MQRYTFFLKQPNFWRNIFYYLKTLLTFIVDFSDVHNHEIKIIITRIMCINPFPIIAFNISIVVIYYVKNKVKKLLVHQLLHASQHLAYITNLYHSTNSQQDYLACLSYPYPQHRDSYNFKTNCSDSEKSLHNFKEKPRNKAKKQIYEPSL